MTDERFPTGTVVGAIAWGMSLPGVPRGKFFAALYQAVTDYKTTRDGLALSKAVGDLLVAFSVQDAASKQPGKERSVKEVVAELAEQWPRAPEPTLAEVAFSLAEREGSPLAAHPHLILRAADKLLAEHPGVDPDDILHLAARWL